MTRLARCFLACALALVLGAGCYGTKELCDLPDGGAPDADAGADPDPGRDADAGADADAKADADPGFDPDAEPPTDTGIDLAGGDDGQVFPDIEPFVPPAPAWLASFRCPTLAGPLYPGVRIPADDCTLVVRASPYPAVETLEIYVGTGRLASLKRPAETEELSVKWRPFPDREIVLRTRAVAADGSESESVVPIRTLPEAGGMSRPCGTLDLRVDRPDPWEALCGRGRLKAALSWTPDGFGPQPDRWRIQAKVAGVSVATADQATFDADFEIPAGKAGVLALDVTGSAWLPAGGCCAGPDPCQVDVVRHLVVQGGAEGCQAPACDVALDGPSDRVVEGSTWAGAARLEPDTPGATIRLRVDHLDWGTALDGTGGAVEVPDLQDGVHVVQAVALLPDGGTCTDRARFATDGSAPLLELPGALAPNFWGRLEFTVTTRDTTVVPVTLQVPGGWGCDAPEPRAAGTVQWPCYVDLPGHLQQATLHVTGRDEAGHAASIQRQVATAGMLSVERVALDVDHYHPGPVDFPFDEDAGPRIVFGPVQVRVTVYGLGLTAQNLALMGFAARVDDAPASEAGLALAPSDVGYAPASSRAVLVGTWDTRRVADGIHRLTATLSDGRTTWGDSVEVEVRSGALSGRQPELLLCDPAFTACGPLGTGHVAGDAGVRADLSWWTAAEPPTVRLMAAGEEVARCQATRCDWLLRWEDQPRSALEVSAEAVGTGVLQEARLATSARLVRDLHDRDDDGFRGVEDGGSDCDDEDPFTNPARADPAGPGCAMPGAPVQALLSEAPAGMRVLDAARDPEGTLHVVLCDPGLQALRVLRAPAGEAVEAAEPPGVGTAWCEDAAARFGRGADGRLWLALAPGDGTAGVAVVEASFPPVLDEVTTFGGTLRALLPDGVLAAEGGRVSVHRRVDGAWSAATVLEGSLYDGSPGQAAAWVDPDGGVQLAVRSATQPVALGRLAPAVPFDPRPLPADARHRPSGLLPREAHGAAGEWEPIPREANLGLVRDAAGNLALLESVPDDLALAGASEPPPPVLWTGGPDRWRAHPLDAGVLRDDGHPGYRLRTHTRATLGLTADGVPVAATLVRALNPHWIPERIGPDGLQVVVPRGDRLVELPEARGLAPADPVAVGGALGAAEVVLRDDRAGQVSLVSWPCAALAALDSDCNGQDGPAGLPCQGDCTADLARANRVAGAMPLCSGGVSDGVRQAGESCDGGAAGMASGCRDCDFVDMPLDVLVPGINDHYDGHPLLATASGTVLLPLAAAPAAGIRLLELDPEAPETVVARTLEPPSGRLFWSRPVLVRRADGIVVLAATRQDNGMGPLHVIRLDDDLQPQAAGDLGLSIFPRLALALPDGDALFVGTHLDGQSLANGRLVRVDPDALEAQVVLDWETVPAGRLAQAWSLTGGAAAGDVALLRTWTNWNTDDTAPSSRIVAAVLDPATGAVRREWALELPATVISAALAPSGADGYLVAWSQEADVATAEDPTVGRTIRAQRLDPDLQPVGTAMELDAFRCFAPEWMTVAAAPLPSSAGPGVVVTWGRADRIGPTRRVVLEAAALDVAGRLSGPAAVFDTPLYTGGMPEVVVTGPDALAVVAGSVERLERARFLDPRRLFGPGR